jgi:hypothetical protein
MKEIDRLTKLVAIVEYVTWSFAFLYVNDVLTSQETHVYAYTACYGDSFNFIYVDYVRTSQETRL